VKSSEEIMNPTPLIWKWKGNGSYPNGLTFDILPVPDSVMQTIMREVALVATVVFNVGGNGSVEGEEAKEPTTGETISTLSKRTPREWLEYIPEIVQVLLPNATKIIASSLAANSLNMLGNEEVDFSTYRRRERIGEEWVDDNLSRGARFDALTRILEAEDFGFIIEGFNKLSSMIPAMTPAPITADSTEPSSTNSSAVSTDGQSAE
jgi:hypothetical protein